MELGEQIANLREAKALTQVELAEKANISPSTLSQVESGRVPRPHVGTVRKIARALGVEPAELRRVNPEELTARPKVKPPLPLSPEPGEAERRLTKVPEVLGSYIFERMERHEAELGAADSPHFKTATSATLWLAGVEEEAAGWKDWALNQAAGIMPVPQAGSTVSNLVERFYDGLEIMAFRIPLDGIKNRAEERIKAMNDLPDELAARKLEQAKTAEAEAEERFVVLRANG